MSVRINISSQKNQSKGRAFVGGLICTAFSVTGFYVAIGGEALSGGIPFIPDTWNQMIGRITFAIGACITGALALYAFYTDFKPAKKERHIDETKAGDT